jgi:hypothetical protein
MQPPSISGKAGESVPKVSPDDIRAVFKLQKEVAEGHPGQSVGIGASLYENCCSKGADIAAVWYRSAFLQMMVAQGKELAPWIDDGQPNDVLVRAIAEIPMKWIGRGVEHKGLPFDQDDFMRRLRGNDGPN